MARTGTEFISAEKALVLVREFAAEKKFPVEHSEAEIETGPQEFRTFTRTHSGFRSGRFRKALSKKRFWVVYLRPAKRGSLGPDAWIFVDAVTGKVLESQFGL
jgi:hypothetical protein